MKRSLWLACLTLACAGGLSAAPPAKPNIVLIVADDLGWADVSFHGSRIQTPNIDRITREGVELDRFYACPVCSPTRAGLMTGRYPIRFGLMGKVVSPWRQDGLSTAETTLPEVLARAGYTHRGMFGKWHLGHAKAEYHPLRRGFTEYVGHYNGNIDYFTHLREDELDWHRGFEANHDEGYSTDLLAEAAVDFIERHGDGQAPFFCYLPFNAPHDPYQAKPADLAAYADLADEGKPVDNERKGNTHYGAIGQGQSDRQTLAAMISALDQGIGRVLEALDRKGLSDNTLVWFFSDNGGIKPGDNRPLRDQKGSVFEGGVRVAAALRWPGKVPAGGKVTAQLGYIDVLPTLMAVAGLEDSGGQPLDGINALPGLTGSRLETQRDWYSYVGIRGDDKEQAALTEARWKLVVTGRRLDDETVPLAEREVFLFDLPQDPYEQHNLAKEHPETVSAMAAKLRAFRELQPADSDHQVPKGWKPPHEWAIPGTESNAR